MKNLIGFILGYGRCPLCGRTWWMNDPASDVHLAPEAGNDKVMCKPCAKRWYGFAGTVTLNGDPRSWTVKSYPVRALNSLRPSR